MELLDRLLDIERKLWTNDAPLYRDTLLHDAILIFPETDVITTESDEFDELDDLVEEDLLVEEISIDGMCGVY